MAALGRSRSVELHGRYYQLPKRPTVVVCVDGFDPDYLSAAIADGILPTMSSWVKTGFHATAKCAMPGLTNPNNLSIITGAATVVHGISGNYYLDKVTGKEHMVLDDSTMWGSTILEQMANAGVRVAAITAKDKLRKIIDHGLSPDKGAICFSSQYAQSCTEGEHGIHDVEQWLGRPQPSQYSADLSLFVLDAGLKLLKENRADLLYLTLSDGIQHKYPPRAPEADEFLHNIDVRLAEFVKLGAVVVVTGDHGMSDKSDEHGKPNVLYLEDFLNTKWSNCGARVMCPIADPFVKHHGALGGFVRVHLRQATTGDIHTMLEECRKLPQVEMALTGEDAAAIWEMPVDREGDIVVVAKKDAAVGSRQDEHDLSSLEGHRLRSHGGLSEQAIPLLRSEPIEDSERMIHKQWRNFDAFDIALNY